MPRILVTGATGLIGRATVLALINKGHDVVALSRSGERVSGAIGVACDLSDPHATRQALETAKAGTLVHLAWLKGEDRWHGAANLDWVQHSLRLVQQFAASGGARVVGAGSCAEYDWSEPVLSETTRLRPETAYGAAKAAAGLALQGAATDLNISLAWARIFFVFGPGEPRGRLFGDVIQGLSAGESVDCTDGTQTRDYLHVDDVGRGIALLAVSKVTGAINIGHGTPIAVSKLVHELARQLNADDRIRLGALQRPIGDPDELAADVTRARQELGFAPEIDWREAVRRVLESDLAL